MGEGVLLRVSKASGKVNKDEAFLPPESCPGITITITITGSLKESGRRRDARSALILALALTLAFGTLGCTLPICHHFNPPPESGQDVRRTEAATRA